MTADAQIFSPARRAAARDRAARGRNGGGAENLLHRRMADDLIDRLGDVTRVFTDCLLLGCPDAQADDSLAIALRARGMRVLCADPGFANAQAAARGGPAAQVDEDALPFADDSFDLIIACGTLDSVNDLPGALILLRRALRPDGLLLGAFPGAGSLTTLRRVLLEGDGNRPAQRVHPLVDVRAMGDLLARAGLALPVVDTDQVTIRYGNLFTLIADLRAAGATNMLASAPPPLTRQSLTRAAQAFAARAEPDGKTAESVSIIHLSAWKPDASQPKPARRGSGTTSLAAALKGKG